MKKVFQIVAFTLIFAGLSILASAQNTISPEKKKLIAEIVSLTKMDKQITEMTDMLLRMSDSIYEDGIKQELNKHPELTQEQKDTIRKTITERSQAFSKKFRERLPIAINFTEFVDQAIYPIYDKVFTEKELSDLVVFYRSESGQKFLSAMPQLAAESIEMTQKLLTPKVMKLVEDIIAEDLTEMKQPPAPKRN
jgi:uncharacterized protein